MVMMLTSIEFMVLLNSSSDLFLVFVFIRNLACGLMGHSLAALALRELPFLYYFADDCLQ